MPRTVPYFVPVFYLSGFIPSPDNILEKGDIFGYCKPLTNDKMPKVMRKEQ
jgi:hypothetical protein